MTFAKRLWRWLEKDCSHNDTDSDRLTLFYKANQPDTPEKRDTEVVTLLILSVKC